MRTTKPISTISYNTDAYLRGKLDGLLKNGIIEFWVYIHHIGEPASMDDDAPEKDHIHVYVIPAKMLQTTDLAKHFIEIQNDGKPPLQCILWRSSKWGDWYLYGLHDPGYLLSKGLTRKYHYSHSDMISSDPDTLYTLSKSINMLEFSPYKRMHDAWTNGLSFSEFLQRGGVPIQQVTQYRAAWFEILERKEEVVRGGRPSHSPKIDDPMDSLDADQITLIRCDVCGQLLPEYDFTIYYRADHGLHGICRSCLGKYSNK